MFMVLSLSLGKVLVNGGHPLHLLHAEGTAAFAVATAQAGIRFDAQLGIMVGGDGIPSQGKVVIFVHQTDIDACRAGLAVVAVDAGSGNGVGGEGADDGIVLLLIS